MKIKLTETVTFYRIVGKEKSFVIGTILNVVKKSEEYESWLTEYGPVHFSEAEEVAEKPKQVLIKLIVEGDDTDTMSTDDMVSHLCISLDRNSKVSDYDYQVIQNEGAEGRTVVDFTVDIKG